MNWLESPEGVGAQYDLAAAARHLAAGASKMVAAIGPAELGRVTARNMVEGGKITFALDVRPGKAHQVRVSTTSKKGARVEILQIELPAEE